MKYTTLKTCYKLESIYTKEENISSFQCQGTFQAVRKENSQYTFTFDNKEQILINKHYPQQIMDKIMLQMGASLYPLQLLVSSDGELLSVENFMDISERWNKEAQILLSKQDSPLLSRYIDNSKKNIENREALKQSLMHDNLIKLLFCGLFSLKQNFYLTFENFPERGQTQVIVCSKKMANDREMILDNTSSSNERKTICIIRYLLGAQQEIERISANIVDVVTRCSKKIEIVLSNKTENTKSWILFEE